MRLMVLSVAATLLLSAVDARDAACDVENMAALLGTNKYLLYGLTADCQLFFALDVPDGANFGDEFGPKPMFEDEPLSVDENNRTQTFDCSNATLQPLRDGTGKLRLLLTYKIGATEVYASVHDFMTPQMGAWFVKSSLQPVLVCHKDDNKQPTCQTPTDATKLGTVNYTAYDFRHELYREYPSGIFGFVDQQESAYYLIKPKEFMNEVGYRNHFVYNLTLVKFTLMSDGRLQNHGISKNLTGLKDDNIDLRTLVATDVYDNYMYFEKTNRPIKRIERYRLSEVLLEKFGFNEWLGPWGPRLRYDLGKFSIANNKLLAVDEHKEGEQLSETQIYIYWPDKGNRSCIGRLRQSDNDDDYYIHYNQLDNFQIHALLNDRYDEVLKANPRPAATSTSSSTMSTTSTTTAINSTVAEMTASANTTAANLTTVAETTTGRFANATNDETMTTNGCDVITSLASLLLFAVWLPLGVIAGFC